MTFHRNSQKRIIFEDACYFVTFYPKHRYPYFKESIFCDLFVENLKLCKQLKGFLLFGWVIVYNHIHLLFQPSDKFDISKIMQFLKRHISRNINIVMRYKNLTIATNTKGNQDTGHKTISPSSGNVRGTTAPPLPGDDRDIRGTTAPPLPGDDRDIRGTTAPPLPGSDIGQCRFQKEGVPVDKLISQKQATHNFDLKVLGLRTRFSIKHFSQNPFPKFRWQKSFFDEYIRTDSQFDHYMGYISWNPTKHNLPSNWPYVYTNQIYENLCDIS